MEGTTSLETLAEGLADWEFAGSGVTPTTADYGRTRAALESVHIPQLVEAAMVEFDADREWIALTEATRQVIKQFARIDLKGGR